ncbi:probable guanine nucleotide-binding protein alpha-4 subunit [Ustilago bromivora]|uniref:Probable guanine nucleotide-binding protein alpha-4 subunit n=1 Tax=Ustilago bromivora TaxID=307758 RepID=A0A1K0GC40_9BASI|nr:probable guanine nucleotide-binding protein alpha-4 subunit [Ustilago bromivora]SYW76128.1 probable guanine nucleotide-binding protein alpha-4 subunit [Ustilago bromivora]
MSPSVSAASKAEVRRSKSKRTLTTKLDRKDPLSLALLPPSNETPSQKAARLAAEKEAKQRSDEIDRLLNTCSSPSSLASSVYTSDSALWGSKKGRVYKMVLLGQAGAGKTTVLKQMRLLYDPAAHERERRGWVKIVLLNLTASVRVLLESMASYYGDRAERKSAELGSMEGAVGEGKEEGDNNLGPRNEVNEEVRMGWMKHLEDVKGLESKLRVELGAFGEEVELPGSNGVHEGGQEKERGKGGDKGPLLFRPGWQERLFTCARRSFSLTNPSRPADPQQSQPVAEQEGGEGGEQDASTTRTITLLTSIQTDVLGLWNDDPRCRALHKRGLFLDSQSDAATSFFLDSYTRILSPLYSPSDEDILHSRVRTLGVSESIFRIDKSLTYRIYDVGGSRSQRTAWAPFLDDVESIIFLAPLSAFDQPLIEDPDTNRLADTFALFNQIVSNPLLSGASIILFLNKIDLLEKKLRAGVKLGKYWVEYEGDNDFEAVWRWFRGKFRECLRMAEDEMGGGKRRLYVHTTVATSTKQIRAILMSVKDNVLRENLKVTGLVG